MNRSQKTHARGPVTQEYSGLAPSYDATWAHYVDASTERTIERLRLRPGERVLDVGCGTGVLLQRLSAVQPNTLLAGVDPVPQMLAVARRRLSPAVGLVAGWAGDLPFMAAQFDVVVSCSAFHYFHDPEAALREMRRVLRPGGRLVITDWCGDYLACRLLDGYLRLFNRAHFKTYRKKELVRLLRDAGFTVDEMSSYNISWLWGLMTVTAKNAACKASIKRGQVHYSACVELIWPSLFLAVAFGGSKARPSGCVSSCRVPCDSIEQRVWRFAAARDAIAQLRKQLGTAR